MGNKTKNDPPREGSEAEEPKKPDTTKPKPPSKVTELPATSYQPDEVAAFLAKVFHVELLPDEEILTWNATKVPGYPIAEEDMLTKLKRLKKHQAFYYGTSTCRRSDDGYLYNRKSLFCRLHTVVLDDIGTKIERADLPADLEPTYIIESSEGNEQWGFVLEEPIDSLAHAQLFVSLVYNSGFTDTGGNMPTKLVRLPAGFNMKTGRETMPVKLIKDDGPRWTPDDLLLALDTGVRWGDIVNDPDTVRKESLAKTQGTTVWSPVHAEMPTFDGIVDPALEWLYDMKLVYQERDEWVDIKCPWAHEHTQKGAPHDRAGYAPLGWGGEDHRKSRGFNCFHDACAHRTGADILEYIATHGGPELPVFDYVPEMLSTYVYDPTNDQVWDVKNETFNPTPLAMGAMRNLYARKVRHLAHDGTLKHISPVGLWMVNPARVVTKGGPEYRPGCRSTLFQDESGNLKINLFRMKAYSDVPIDEAAIAPFYKYVEYLMPLEEEREMFLNWLAAKVQNPEFRGPALFMIAEKQGIGRNTLMDMIGLMFGQQHVKHVPFNRLLNQGSYNTFQESLFVVVDETLAVEDYANNRRAGDILKELIDPRPQHVMINPKYGRQRDVWSVSSYVFLSNHMDGLKLTAGDRRYYAIRNAEQPAPPAYFREINAWMAGGGWEQHLWNDLLSREVDEGTLLAPPKPSETMKEVIVASRSPMEMIIEAFIEHWPTDFVPRTHCRKMVALVGATNKILPDNVDGVFRHVWKQQAAAADRNSTVMRVAGVGHRFGVVGAVVNKKLNTAHPDWEVTMKAMESYDETAMLGQVLDSLSEQGLEV